MKEKGFTLIELLAVIVILAIIALIATPIVLNIIEDSKKSAFVQSANGIVDAAEYYYFNEMLDRKKLEDTVINFPNIGELKFDGEIPKKGSVIINTDGEVAIAISNDKYCVVKGYKDGNVTITENIDECYNPATIKKLSEITTSTDECVLQGKKCNRGTLLPVQVNDSETHNFYVLSDDGNKISLIMNINLIDGIEWISEDDYDGDNYGKNGNNEKGPITALNALQERTKDWTNLLEQKVNSFQTVKMTSYCLSEPDEAGECDYGFKYIYEDIPLGQTYTMYVRMPVHKDLGARYYEDHDVERVSSFLYNGSPYWIAGVNKGKTASALIVSQYDESDGTENGGDKYAAVSQTYVSETFVGIRPVIQLYK